MPSKDGSSRAWRRETFGVMRSSVERLLHCIVFGAAIPEQDTLRWLGPVLAYVSTCGAGPLCWNMHPPRQLVSQPSRNVMVRPGTLLSPPTKDEGRPGRSLSELRLHKIVF